MSSLRTKVFSVAIILLLAYLPGCLDLDDVLDDEDEFENGSILPETTKQLTGSELDALISVSADSVEIVFDGTKGDLPSLDHGDILSIGIGEHTPYGLLRKISSVDRDGKKLTVRTVQAKLEEAIKKGKVSLNESLVVEDMVVRESLPGVSIEKGGTRAGGDGITFTDVVVHTSEGGRRTLLSGNMDLDVSLIFELDIDLFIIKECRFGVLTTFSGDLMFGSNEELTLDQKFEAATFSFAPIIVPVGGIEVIFVPVLSLVIGIRGTVEAGLVMEASQISELNGYVEHPDWVPRKDFSATFEFSTPVIGTECLARGFVGPELSVLIYGVVGPYISVHAYVEGEASLTGEERSWWLYGGMEFGMGFVVKVLGVTLKDWSDPDIIELRRLIASSAQNLAEGWAVEKIDTNHQLGLPLMASGAQGTVHVLYVTQDSDSNDILKLATRKDGSWSFTELADLIDSFYLHDVKVDKDGRVHFAYQKVFGWTKSIGYGWTDGGEVHLQNFSDPDMRGRYMDEISIVLDDGGEPVIYYSLYERDNDMFFDFGPGMIKRAVLTNGGWSVQRSFHRTGVSTTGMFAAMDGRNNVHLTHFTYVLDGDVQELVYNRSGPDGDLSVVLFEEELFFNDPSESIISMSSDGRPVVLFDDNNGTLHLVRENGGSWVTEEKMSIERFDSWSVSLLVMNDGAPVVSYINKSGKFEKEHSLKFSVLDEGGWDVFKVFNWTSPWQIPGGTSMAQHADSTMMIAFNDGRYLRLAIRAPS